MRDHALSDGEQLNYASYCRYGEWVPSDSLKEAGENNLSHYAEMEEDAVLIIERCPWALQFHEMGVNETIGSVYCSIVDQAIVEGFNPDLRFETTESLMESDHCRQVMYDSNLSDQDLSKHMEYVQPWSYHSGHLFAVMERYAGEDISREVLDDFEREFGKESVLLLEHEKSRF